MHNRIVILRKVFKFGGIQISISWCKVLAFFSSPESSPEKKLMSSLAMSVCLKFKFRLQIASYKFRFRQTLCTSLSSVEIHFQSNRYFTAFIVFSTSILFIDLCTTFIQRIIHNLICSDARNMRHNVQCTLYMIVL